jgi:hypothetical protein
LAGAFSAPAIPAFASSSPVTSARVVAYFDIAALQQPAVPRRPCSPRWTASPAHPRSPCTAGLYT